MTRERFETMVRRLEGQAEKRPGLYRVRVGLLALLGYAYILAVLAALVAVVGLLVMALIYSHACATVSPRWAGRSAMDPPTHLRFPKSPSPPGAGRRAARSASEVSGLGGGGSGAWL